MHCNVYDVCRGMQGSLIAAAFVDSVWGLFLLYGFLSGSGYGITNYNVAVSLVMRVVPKHRRGVAAGVCTAGSPLGQMLLIPGFEWLIETSGWRQGRLPLIWGAPPIAGDPGGFPHDGKCSEDLAGTCFG